MHGLTKVKTSKRQVYNFPITTAKQLKQPLKPQLKKLLVKHFINIITAPKAK